MKFRGWLHFTLNSIAFIERLLMYNFGLTLHCAYCDFYEQFKFSQLTFIFFYSKCLTVKKNVFIILKHYILTFFRIYTVNMKQLSHVDQDRVYSA